MIICLNARRIFLVGEGRRKSRIFSDLADDADWESCGLWVV